MGGNFPGTAILSRRLGFIAFMLWACSPSAALSQTPSLQEWQYSSGIVLERLFEPNLPEWRVVLGAAASMQLGFQKGLRQLRPLNLA
jgi:hypothetical protein